jgi:hypothetical protein
MTKREHWQVRTHTNQHYISTSWVNVQNEYETMIFTKRKGKVDWAGKYTHRANSKKQAILNHWLAVKKAFQWEE